MRLPSLPIFIKDSRWILTRIFASDRVRWASVRILCNGFFRIGADPQFPPNSQKFKTTIAGDFPRRWGILQDSKISRIGTNSSPPPHGQQVAQLHLLWEDPGFLTSNSPGMRQQGREEWEGRREEGRKILQNHKPRTNGNWKRMAVEICTGPQPITSTENRRNGQHNRNKETTDNFSDSSNQQQRPKWQNKRETRCKKRQKRKKKDKQKKNVRK